MILAGKTDVHDWQPNLNLTINMLSRYFAVLKAHEEVKWNFDFKKNSVGQISRHFLTSF